MMIREPAVAGTFYPKAPENCRRALEDCFSPAKALPLVQGRLTGGVVPHAGWACSGKIAASVFSALAAHRNPKTVVVFGAVHRPKRSEGALFVSGRWETPLGSITIDDRLGQRVMGHTNLIVDDPYAHEPEHSIEVQVPFIQRLWPESRLLPIMVPPSPRSTEIGSAVGRTLLSYDYDAVVLASSDLTHYGSRYGFTPMGSGEKGLEWAKNVNDRLVIDKILELDAEAIVAETSEHRNACGGGAIAAVMAAARTLGARRGVLLAHATSAETVGLMGDDNAVGYAGVVFVDD